MIPLIIGGINADAVCRISKYKQGVEESVEVTTSPTGRVFSDLAYRRNVIEATLSKLPCVAGAALLSALRQRPCQVTYFNTATGAAASGVFVCEDVPLPEVMFLDGGQPVYEPIKIKLIAAEGIA